MFGLFTRPPHPDDLERASAILRNMAIPGLVEMYDESLVAAEYFLQPAFAAVTLEYIPQNISRPLGPTDSVRTRDRLERLVRLWGADLFQDLVRFATNSIWNCSGAPKRKSGEEWPSCRTLSSG